jgi:PAS domain S-box-containing protein
MIDQDGTFKYINPKFTELFGYDLTDIPDGKTWFRKAYPDPDYRHHVISAWLSDLKIAKEGELRPQAFTVMCKDGSKKVINFISVKLDTGENLIACEDITERIRAEEALRKSEAGAKRLAEENELVAEIGRIIGSTLNTEEVYERFAEEATKLIPFDQIAIHLACLEKGYTTIAYNRGVAVPQRKVGEAVSLAGTFTEEVLKNRKGQIVQGDEKEIANRFPGLIFSIRMGLRSMMSVPLFSKDEVIGALNFRSFKANAYSERDLHLAERIGNQIAGAIANAQLFAEHKRNEDEISRLAAIVQESVDAIFTTDNQDRITFWNRGAELLFGYRPEEALGQSVNLLIPHELQEERKKIQALLSKESFVRNYETGRLAKGGRLVPVNITLMEVRDEKGQRISLTGILRDISESKKHALEREAHYQELKVLHDISQIILSSQDLKTVLGEILDKTLSLGSFDLGVIRLLDPSGEFLEPVANRGYRDLKNVDKHPKHTKDPTTGRIIAQVITYKKPRVEENVPECNGLRTFKAEGIQSAIVVPIRVKERGLGTIQLGSRSPRKFQENEIRLLEAIGNQIGITVQKARLYEDTIQAYEQLKTTHERMIQTEEALHQSEEQLRQSQKMEAIGQLAGGIAHDFNNLLTVIKGYSQLSLLDIQENVPLKENIEEIQKASERASNLTRQLLAFSRRQILDFKVVNLNTIIEDLDKMLHRILGEDIELKYILAEKIGKVRIDPGQIEQVIMNLAVNARDAMPSGGRLIIETSDEELDLAYAHTHVATTPGHYIRLTVSDTGFGMSPEVRDRVFEPFFSTKEKGKGTGLGLSTVYGIVKQSGGNIWVYSEPGKGTTFKIYFPRVDAPLEEWMIKGDVQGIPCGTETILVVEDEENVRELTLRILKKQGYRVLEARDGNEALLLFKGKGESIDLILTDMVMPGMSGRQLVDQLKTIHKDLKMLYMSGYTENAITHEGILEEGTNYIQKPFTLEKLAMKVRQVLDN